MKPTDLPLLTSVSRPTIHPDGSLAVFATATPNLDADAYVGQLWSVLLDGSAGPRRITRGFSDSSPRFSPDGLHIAFLRSDGENPAQLHIVDARGGEAVPATDEKLGVSTFEWSPNGDSLAYTARRAEQGRYGTVKELGAGAEPPRRIITRKYQSNGLGYTNDRRNHIFLVDAPDASGEPTYRRAPSAEEPTPEPRPTVPEARQLTDGDYDNGYIRFSPDGKHLAFVSARHAERDVDLANNIHEFDLGKPDAEPVALTGRHTHYGIDGFAYAPDGTIYFVGSDLGEHGRDFVGRNGALYRLDKGGSPAVRVTDPSLTDLAEGANELLVTADGTVLALNRWRGNVELVAVGADGTLGPVAAGNLLVHGFDEAGGTIVLSYSDATTMGDIAVIRDGGLDRLTDFSAELTKAGIAPVVETTIPARDGTPIHGWVLMPSGDGPHPVLLTIHGGPYTQYTGSFLDGALAGNPSFDAQRLGIMGGSYGGYLTAWTIAHDHRFSAAIVERGYLDPEGMIGTSDIGDFFGDEYTGTDPAQIRAQSPQAFVHQVTTPTLVLHSENDLRCPLSQGERYYSALKRQGVHTELLVFPGENHELSRSGRPRHRLQRFEAVLDWWERHLPVTGT